MLPYSTAQFPNSIVSADDQAIRLYTALVYEFGCAHPDAEFFYCATVFQECGESSKLPCRGLCEAVTSECVITPEFQRRLELLSLNFNLSCDAFPDESDGQCLSTLDKLRKLIHFFSFLVINTH